MSALSDGIYRIFCDTKIVIELWKALDYSTVEKGLKIVFIDDWLDFQMVDGKSVSDQLNDFKDFVYEMKTKEIEQSETVYVSSLIKNDHILGLVLL